MSKSTSAHYYSESQVLYTDTAEHDHKVAMIAVVTDEYATIKNSCSLIGTITEEAEEVAIALAITTADVRTIISDSKIAIRNLACSCMSPSANRILEAAEAPP